MIGQNKRSEDVSLRCGKIISGIFHVLYTKVGDKPQKRVRELSSTVRKCFFKASVIVQFVVCSTFGLL